MILMNSMFNGAKLADAAVARAPPSQKIYSIKWGENTPKFPVPALQCTYLEDFGASEYVAS